jgi:predicted nucleic acid-binding protein
VVQPFVIDTSILIQGFVREPNTAHVRSLLQETIIPEPTVALYVPEFCVLECANILWKRVVLYKKPIVETEQALGNLLAFPLVVRTSAEYLRRAFGIGVAHQLAIYDAIYLAFAERFACPLITADERQARAAQAVGVTLKPITDFPEFTEQQ